jgi:hypothetical protein
MEAFVMLVIVVAALLVLDTVAMKFGVDSRDSIGDDRVRSLAS